MRFMNFRLPLTFTALTIFVACSSGPKRFPASYETNEAIDLLNEYAIEALEDSELEGYEIEVMEGRSCFFEDSPRSSRDRDIRTKEKFNALASTIDEGIIFLERYDEKSRGDKEGLFAINKILICSHRELGKQNNEKGRAFKIAQDGEFKIGVPFGYLSQDYSIPTALEMEEGFIRGDGIVDQIGGKAQLPAKLIWGLFNPMGKGRKLLRSSFESERSDLLTRLKALQSSLSRAPASVTHPLRSLIQVDRLSEFFGVDIVEWYDSLNSEEKIDFLGEWIKALDNPSLQSQFLDSAALVIERAAANEVRTVNRNLQGAPLEISSLKLGVPFLPFGFSAKGIRLEKGIVVTNDHRINIQARFDVGPYEHLIETTNRVLSNNTEAQGSLIVDTIDHIDVQAGIQVNTGRNAASASFQEAFQAFQSRGL